STAAETTVTRCHAARVNGVAPGGRSPFQAGQSLEGPAGYGLAVAVAPAGGVMVTVRWRALRIGPRVGGTVDAEQQRCVVGEGSGQEITQGVFVDRALGQGGVEGPVAALDDRFQGEIYQRGHGPVSTSHGIAQFEMLATHGWAPEVKSRGEGLFLNE